MSKLTRINRPTTATSTKARKGRMVHQSTNMAWITPPVGKDGVTHPAVFVKTSKGSTY